MGRRKGKRGKFVVEFDELKRAAFLTGFKKRKDERRKKAKKEIEDMAKAERKKLKAKKESMRRDQLKEFDDVSEVINAADAEKKTFELPQHWVTVTEISDIDFVGATGAYLGTNEDNVDDEDDKDNQISASGEDAEKRKAKKLKKKLSMLKKKGKRHVNFTHTHHKRRKLDADDRTQIKRKLKRSTKIIKQKKAKS